MRYFAIRNWTKYQHYKHRNPPWIRLHRTLLRDRDYQKLSDAARSHLVGLFLIASQTENRIPDDQQWLKHELCTRMAIDLKTLAAIGVIEYLDEDASSTLAASTTLAERKRDAAPETDSSEVQKNRSTETEVQMLAYGEFGSVRLSSVQFEKLKAKLNGNLEQFINRLDRYSQSNPAKFKRYRSHYAVILDWYDLAISRGEIKNHATRASPAMPTEEEIAREHAAMFGGRKKVT